MLIAIDQYGKKFLAEEATKNTDYYCPFCKKRVILKKGKIRIPHFAHYANECEMKNLYKEPESAEHRKIKYLLYKHLKSYGAKVELEKFFKEAIADIYVEINNKKFVIEIQKSTLKEEIFLRRMKFYTKNNIPVLWIIAPSTIEKQMRFYSNEETETLYDYFQLNEWLKNIVKIYFGYLYTIDLDTKKIKLISLENKYVYVEYNKYTETGDYFKKLKNRKEYEIIEGFDILKDFQSNKYKSQKYEFLTYEAMLYKKNLKRKKFNQFL